VGVDVEEPELSFARILGFRAEQLEERAHYRKIPPHNCLEAHINILNGETWAHSDKY
jgi:hypothetical protein